MNDRMVELNELNLEEMNLDELVEAVVVVEPEIKDLIIIEQLPIIRQRLEEMSLEIDNKTAYALSLEVTEETVKTVKEVRTELTKEFTELEGKRKEVKNAVMSPYDEFESIYKELISNKFKAADSALKTKIDAVEDGLKLKKEKNVMRYFEELTAAESIDFVSFYQVGLNITLTATEKALKAQTLAFIERVKSDLALIDVQALKSEIMVEYKRSLNVSKSITDVAGRHKALEEEKARQIEREAARIAQSERVARVDTFLPPPVQTPVTKPQAVTAPLQAPSKEYNATFKVFGTIDQLKALKAYLVSNNLRFENVPVPTAAVPPVVPQAQPEPIEQPKAPEQPKSKIMPVAFVQFQKNGAFVGREYSYVIPEKLIPEVKVNSLVDIATRNGIGSAVVTRLGTTADVAADIIPRLLLIEGMTEKKEEEK